MTPIRTGIGYDIHRLVPQRRLILGGVLIPSELGLLGHSDADVLLHAICDALLGAAALGDIGKHFPDTNLKFKDVSSLILLIAVRELLEQNRFQVINLDSTVVLERPKIASFIPEMQRNIAETLSIQIDQPLSRPPPTKAWARWVAERAAPPTPWPRLDR
jgi:2-C-methyl-D-erythritol 2,4-cyclodiphosphate synthase